jgi:hypothetical protein
MGWPSVLDLVKAAKLVSLIDSCWERCAYAFWKRCTNSLIRTCSFEKPIIDWGVQWRRWLRYCATGRKDAGSFPDGPMVSGRTMALESSQPLTEVPGVSPGGKGGRCILLKTLPPSCADRRNSGSQICIGIIFTLQFCTCIVELP